MVIGLLVDVNEKYCEQVGIMKVELIWMLLKGKVGWEVRIKH